jgi:hypothetical protein
MVCFIIFRFREAVGAFLILWFVFVAAVVLILFESVIVLVLFKSLVILVGNILGTGFGTILDIAGSPGTKHVALSVIIGTEFVGLSLDGWLVGSEASFIVEFGVLEK